MFEKRGHVTPEMILATPPWRGATVEGPVPHTFAPIVSRAFRRGSWEREEIASAYTAPAFKITKGATVMYLLAEQPGRALIEVVAYEGFGRDAKEIGRAEAKTFGAAKKALRQLLVGAGVKRGSGRLSNLRKDDVTDAMSNTESTGVHKGTITYQWRTTPKGSGKLES